MLRLPPPPKTSFFPFLLLLSSTFYLLLLDLTAMHVRQVLTQQRCAVECLGAEPADILAHARMVVAAVNLQRNHGAVGELAIGTLDRTCAETLVRHTFVVGACPAIVERTTLLATALVATLKKNN